MKNRICVRIATVLIGLSFLFFMDSCLKETIPCDEVLSLPSITESGESKLGFLKNGSVWIVSGTDIAGELQIAANEVNVNYYEGEIYLSGGMNRRCEEEAPIDESFDLNLHDVFETGTYEVDSLDYNLGNDSYCFLTYGSEISWRASIGTVSISKLDTTEKIISGTFDFEMYDTDDLTQTLSITEGRFDVKY